MKHLAASLLFAAALSTNAAVLVDTGAPAPAGGQTVDVCGPYDQFLCTQWVALEVSFAKPVSVNAVETWLGTQQPGSLTVAVYSNQGGIPGDISLRSAELQIPTVGRGWVGVEGLSWDLDPGSYWVSFEIRAGQSYYGALDYPVPRPLPTVLMHRHSGGWIDANDFAGGALRISGTVSAVPEPAALSLLLTGIPLLLAWSRRRGVQMA